MPSRRTARVSTSGRISAAALTAACTVHQDTPCAWATSLTARPEAITASTRAPRSRTVQRARTGTWTVASANVPTGHASSAQNQRRFAQRTTTAPATGTSRIRWDLRECTLTCLLYTSDAADDLLCVDLGGRRISKQKK